MDYLSLYPCHDLRLVFLLAPKKQTNALTVDNSLPFNT